MILEELQRAATAAGGQLPVGGGGVLNFEYVNMSVPPPRKGEEEAQGSLSRKIDISRKMEEVEPEAGADGYLISLKQDSSVDPDGYLISMSSAAGAQ